MSGNSTTVIGMVNNMNRKNKDKKLNNKGMSAIIVSFMIALFFFVSLSIAHNMQKTHIKNEIQGIIDNAGVISLRYAVDETKWRDEIIEISEPVAKAKFRKIVNKQLNEDLGNMIDNYTIKELNVYSRNITGQGKGEYYIESLIEVEYPTISWAVDKSSSSIRHFHNFFTGQDETRMVSGEVKDGTGESVIRSVSRLVLR